MATGLKDWVSDKLYDLLGLSDSYTADFLIGTAKKCNSEQLFFKKLSDTGALKVNDSVVSFASELWSKVPHKNVDRYVASREKEKAAVLQYQKNKTYSLLSDDEDDTSSVQQRSKSKHKRTRKEEHEKKGAKRKRNIRTEKAAAWESESEEDADTGSQKKEDSDSDSWEK